MYVRLLLLLYEAQLIQLDQNFIFLELKSLYELTDSSPLPLTLDYGAPSVCYADGVFDSHFNRYVTVMEGRLPNTLQPPRV